MNSYDQQYASISKVLTYKQLNLPKFKEFIFKNYICFDVFVTLPNKKKLWEKWLIYIPTWETKRHCICYNKKNKILINNC
jgi:hypothetical protein